MPSFRAIDAALQEPELDKPRCRWSGSRTTEMTTALIRIESARSPR
jgi:hypothetical protein